MTLAAGVRLGPYEIVAPLGAGGMGEVYRAKDSRLGREVAIKVLPQHLSAHPEIRARFEREAKTISSLNHPHICTLFDVGREGDTDFLVMELVDGETLAQRLAKGPLAIADVLTWGSQIADALDRAHRAGVVHRDLKPGNVMLTRSGAKLMDFGLARATGLAGPAGASGLTYAALTQSPTVAAPLTTEGTIVGTFQYMSPEQLEGKEADARADLWSFGCVLYEMATGKRAFEGPSQASLIAAIMHVDPAPVSHVAPMSPPALDRLVRACLSKDPAERIQSAHDAKLQLGWMSETGSASGMPSVAMSGHGTQQGARGFRGRRELVGGITALLAAAAAALLFGLLRPGAGARDVQQVRAALTLPADVALNITGDDSGPPALSPDGSMLVFGARGRGSGRRLWLRSLDELTVRPLPGTEEASYPFWSPDGRSIGFFVPGQLSRIDLAGGAVLKVCPTANARGGTWSRTGTIVFSNNWISALFQVPASGGVPRPATVLDTTRETTHRWPQFMPDGKHFTYLAASHDAPDSSATLWFASLDGRTRHAVMKSPSNAVYAEGRLLFVRDSTLLAQRFDPVRGRLQGEPHPTREVVQYDPTTWRAMMTASDHGTLVYGSGSNEGGFRVTWFDRTGRRLGTLGPPANHFSLGLAPDGKRAVIETQLTPNADLWVYDVASGAGTPLASHPDDDSQPIWSPDGTRIAFATRREAEQYVVQAVRADGSTPARTLVATPGTDTWALQWIDGGSAFLLGRGNFQTGEDNPLWWYPLDGRPERLLISATPGCIEARVSPNRHWLAYDSQVSGRAEVYVIPMPPAGMAADSSAAPGGRWQVSAGGGTGPIWSADGRELFYSRFDGTLMSVLFGEDDAGFRIVSERPLFHVFQRQTSSTADITPDGQRFLITTANTERQASLVVVTNWSKSLEKP